MVDLKQIIEDLSGIAYHHPQINSFGFGDITQITMDNQTKTEPRYPRCYIVPQQSTLSRGVINYTMSVIILDKILPDYSNQKDVMSDTLTTLTDIFTILYQSYTAQYGDFSIDYEPEFGSTCIPFLEEYETVLGGHTMNLQINQAHDYNRCDLPELPFTPNNPHRKWSELSLKWNETSRTYNQI